MTEPTRDQFAIQQAVQFTETQLQNVIITAAKRAGWLVYHTYDSRRSQPGYPDLHLVHRARGLSLLRELKTQTGRLSAMQVEWMAALTAAGVDASVWRPLDWTNGTIPELLAPSDLRYLDEVKA